MYFSFEKTPPLNRGVYIEFGLHRRWFNRLKMHIFFIFFRTSYSSTSPVDTNILYSILLLWISIKRSIGTLPILWKKMNSLIEIYDARHGILCNVFIVYINREMMFLAYHMNEMYSFLLAHLARQMQKNYSKHFYDFLLFSLHIPTM